MDGNYIKSLFHVQWVGCPWVCIGWLCRIPLYIAFWSRTQHERLSFRNGLSILFLRRSTAARFCEQHNDDKVRLGIHKRCPIAHNDGLMQQRCNSIANALELHLSCTNPWIQPDWRGMRHLLWVTKREMTANYSELIVSMAKCKAAASPVY